MEQVASRVRPVDGLTHNHELFARRANEILGTLARVRGELGLGEAMTVVIEQYVDGEPDPQLKRFDEMIALARRQATIQRQLDDDRERLHHGHLDHDGRTSVGHHYEMLRHDACIYNHLLRSVIELSGQYFSRDELVDWLAAASMGRREWVRAELTGALSEIALHAALQGLPEFRELRYATLEEDLAGYDFVGRWHGQMVTVDAKTGHYYPLSERKHGHKHLEISVPREAVQGLRVTRHGLDAMRRQARMALFSSGQSEHGRGSYRAFAK